MTLEIGKILSTYIGGGIKTAPAEAVKRPQAYKTAAYASIPYERFPQVTDTVPTKGLLAGYYTPTKVFVA